MRLQILSVILLVAIAVGASRTARADAVRPQPASIPTSTTAPDDAAARHAKRTACLKVAKAKKLIGAQRDSFLRDCLAAP